MSKTHERPPPTGIIGGRPAPSHAAKVETASRLARRRSLPATEAAECVQLQPITACGCTKQLKAGPDGPGGLRNKRTIGGRQNGWPRQRSAAAEGPWHLAVQLTLSSSCIRTHHPLPFCSLFPPPAFVSALALSPSEPHLYSALHSTCACPSGFIHSARHPSMRLPPLTTLPPAIPFHSLPHS